MARGTAAAEPADQNSVGTAAPAGYQPGARVAQLFGDGRWYDGTVLEAPWPPGHRWGHWRRVRFDDGETSHGPWVVETFRREQAEHILLVILHTEYCTKRRLSNSTAHG